MKKKILLRTLIPLASVGITLGTALPLVSCSSGSEQSTKTDLSSAYTNPTAYPLQPTNDQIFDFAKSVSSALNSSGLTKYDFVWATTPGSPAIMTVKSDNPDYTGAITIYYTASTSLWIDLVGDTEDDVPIIEGTVNEEGSHNFKIYDNLNNPINDATVTITPVAGTPDTTGIVDYEEPQYTGDDFHLKWTNGTTEETIYQITIQATTDNGLTGSLLVHLDIRPKAASPFIINVSNFIDYFNGSDPTQLVSLKTGSVLSNAIIAHNTNKLVFDISNLTIGSTGSQTFKGCAALSNVLTPFPIEFTGNVVKIFKNAFEDCASISQIILSNATSYTIGSIGANAFAKCTNLTGFSRGGQTGVISISDIASGAFIQCANLKYENINDYVISLTGSDWEPGTKANSGYWKKVGATSFSSSSCLAVGAISFPFARTIGLTGFSSLTEISNLPGGSVGASTFGECTNLTTVQFAVGTAVTGIATQAFWNCTKLSSIVLSSSGWTTGSTIGANAFKDCGTLGGTISGTNAQELRDAIYAKDPTWLPNWNPTPTP